MKAMRFLMMTVLTVLMGTSFISCLDSDESKGSDLMGWFEVTENIYTGGVTLTSDFDDYTFIPKNSSVLKYKDGSDYVKHVYLTLSFPDGDPGLVEGKKQYDVIIDAVYEVIPVKSLSDPTTLEHTGGIYEFIENTPYNLVTWASHSYLTVTFTAPKLTDTSYEHFDAYIDSAEDDVVYLKFVHNQKVTSASEKANGTMSFNLPTKNMLNQFTDLEYFGANKDSIYIVVKADSYRESEKEIVTEKIKARIR